MPMSRNLSWRSCEPERNITQAIALFNVQPTVWSLIRVLAPSIPPKLAPPSVTQSPCAGILQQCSNWFLGLLDPAPSVLLLDQFLHRPQGQGQSLQLGTRPCHQASSSSFFSGQTWPGSFYSKPVPFPNPSIPSHSSLISQHFLLPLRPWHL